MGIEGVDKCFFDLSEEESMAIKYTNCEAGKLTTLSCPTCKNRIRNVWLEKGSAVRGMVVKCKTCGSVFSVKTSTTE